MMVECWICGGLGEDADVCKACQGTGKLHDDADAGEDLDKEGIVG
jgi:DnaJ-class molecular chaperone